MEQSIDAILAEATTNYEVGDAAAHEIAMDSAEMKTLIDKFYDADKAEKDAKKEKSGIRKSIDEALATANVHGTVTFEGNEHKIQVVEKHSYSLNQEKCDEDKNFNTAFERGKLGGIEKNITLKIVPAELSKVIDALRAAGLEQVIADIKHEWVFTGGAEETRKIMESVDDIDVREFVEDATSIQVSAKK